MNATERSEAVITPLANVVTGTLVAPTGLSGLPFGEAPADDRNYLRNGTSHTWVAGVPLAGGTMTGPLLLAADPTVPLGASTRQYVDSKVTAYLPLTGGTISGLLTVNANVATTLPALPVGRTPVRIAGPDGERTGIFLDSWGAQYGPLLSFRQANGTAAAPSATTNINFLGIIEFWGRGTSQYSNDTRAQICCVSAENWTDTAQGTHLNFTTTAIGANVLAERMRIGQGVMIGTNVDPGHTHLNIGGSIYTGGAIGAGDASIELGRYRTGDGNSYIDFHSQAGSDFDLRIERSPGVNGTATINQAGTGHFTILAQGFNVLRVNEGGVDIMRGDLMLSRTTDSIGYILRPNTLGFRNIKFSVAGDAGPLDTVDIRSLQARIVGTEIYATFETTNILNRTRVYRAGTNDPFSVRADSGLYSRITYEAVRTWTAGEGISGHFMIADETAASVRLQIDPAGACVASSAWGIISDERIKRDVSPYTRGLKEIKALEPLEFYFNGKGGTTDDGRLGYGLIAQQVESVVPELVSEMDVYRTEVNPKTDDDTLDKVKTIKPTDLIYAMINAFKEIDARLVMLEGKS